jgi:hypothetical protein
VPGDPGIAAAAGRAGFAVPVASRFVALAVPGFAASAI